MSEDFKSYAQLHNELDKLKADRDELRKALSDLMLVGEHIDLMQGMTMEQLFPHRFKAAREVLAKTELKT